MSSLTNIPYAVNSMNGIIILSDGEATMENGDIIANNISTTNITSDTHTVDGTFTVNGNCILGNSSLDNHTINGTMTFNNIPICDISATSFNNLVNKYYVDSKFIFKTDNINESINGIKTFTIPPEHSSTITTNNQITNKLYVDTKFNSIDLSNYVTLNTAQNITGLKSFTVSLPESSLVPTTSNQLINKKYCDDGDRTLSGQIFIKANQSYVNDRFFNLTVSSIIYPQRLQLNYLTIGKTPSYNFNLDISGSVNFNLNTGPNLIQDNLFLFPPVTGLTAPDVNNRTVIIFNTTNTPATYTYTSSNASTGRTWSWNVSGTGKAALRWIYLNNLTLNYYSSSPFNSYYMFTDAYPPASPLYVEKNLGTLEAGLYQVSFLSYWSGPNSVGSPTGFLTLSLTGSTTTYSYNDAATRNTGSWLSRQFFYEKNSSGATTLRWTAGDSNPASPGFFFSITNVKIQQFTTVRLLDQVGLTSGKVAYLGPSVTKLNNLQAYDATIYNSFTVNGIPSIFNGANNNTNTLCINSTTGNETGSANSNVISIGSLTVPYLKTASKVIAIGDRIDENAANKKAVLLNTVALGSNISTGYQNNIIIGNNNLAILDISNWSITDASGFVSNFSYIGSGNSVIIGHNVGQNSAGGGNELDGLGCGRYSISIGSAANDNNSYNYYYGSHKSFSGAYNGFGINRSTANSPYGFNIAIGVGTFAGDYWDSFNCAIGGYCFNKLNGYVNSGRQTQYNVALGFNAGNRSQEGGFLTTVNNSTYIGANATSNFNNIVGATAIGCNTRADNNYSTAIGTDCSNNIAYSVKLGGDNIDTYISKDAYIRGNIYANSISVNKLDGLDYVTISGNQFISGIKEFRQPIASFKFSPTNTTIGVNAAFNAPSDNVLISSIIIGNNAGYSLGLPVNGNIFNANYNTMIGDNAGYYMKRGDFNTFIGGSAGGLINGNTLSTHNTAIGYESMGSIEYGLENVNIGCLTHQFNTTQPNQWHRNITIGNRAFANTDSFPVQDSVFIGNKTGFSNTNNQICFKNICIGENGLLGGNYDYSVAITSSGPLIRESNTLHLGEQQYTYKTLLHGSLYLMRSSSTIITGATTLSYPLFQSYSFNITANTTITLPIIDRFNIGNVLYFRRVGGTSTTTLSFLPTGSQKIYANSLTGATTATVIIASNTHWCQLMPMQETATTYAWFQVN